MHLTLKIDAPHRKGRHTDKESHSLAPPPRKTITSSTTSTSTYNEQKEVHSLSPPPRKTSSSSTSNSGSVITSNTDKEDEEWGDFTGAGATTP